MPQNNADNFGLYIPTTNVWDTDQIHRLENESEQLKELLIRLYQNLNRMSIALNLKESGIFDLNEFVTGETWFPNPLNTDQQQFAINRAVRRKVLYPGALPNAGTLTVPHGITFNPSCSVVRLYGSATDPVSPFSYITFVYNPGGDISISADDTNVYITTGSDYTMYQISYIIFEYLQN